MRVGWGAGEAFLANRTASAKPRGLRTSGGLRSNEGAVLQEWSKLSGDEARQSWQARSYIHGLAGHKTLDIF